MPGDIVCACGKTYWAKAHWLPGPLTTPRACMSATAPGKREEAGDDWPPPAARAACAGGCVEPPKIDESSECGATAPSKSGPPLDSPVFAAVWPCTPPITALMLAVSPA